LGFFSTPYVVGHNDSEDDDHDEMDDDEMDDEEEISYMRFYGYYEFPEDNEVAWQLSIIGSEADKANVEYLCDATDVTLWVDGEEVEVSATGLENGDWTNQVTGFTLLDAWYCDWDYVAEDLDEGLYDFTVHILAQDGTTVLFDFYETATVNMIDLD
ncbi:MAG: hypothetical protein ACC656_00830, partial [Candidatus Heimdallarchaeota archaeon]